MEVPLSGAGASGGGTDVVERLRNDLPLAVDAREKEEVDEVLAPEAGLGHLDGRRVTRYVDGQDSGVVLANRLICDGCVHAAEDRFVVAVRPDVSEHSRVGVERGLEMHSVAGLASLGVPTDFLSDLLSVGQRGIHGAPLLAFERARRTAPPAGPPVNSPTGRGRRGAVLTRLGCLTSRVRQRP